MSSDAPVLAYARPPGPIRARVLLLRTLMIVLALAFFTVGVVALYNPLLETTAAFGGGAAGTPVAPIIAPDQTDYINRVYVYQASAFLAVFLLAQWMFLFPHGKFRLQSLGGGPLTRRSALAAGFIAMLLSIGLLATLLELSGWWTTLTMRFPDAPHISGTATINHPSNNRDYTQTFWHVWIVMGTLWLVWSGIFLAYARSLDRYTALTRIFRGLIAGTFLELLVAAPAHWYVLSKVDEECYCTRGSYTGVVFGCTSLVWLFGPGVFILWYRERLRRERLLNPPAEAPR